MKKTFLSLAVLFIMAVSIVSCTTNSPKSVADKFLKSFYSMDFDAAKKVSTDDTKKMLDMFQQLTPMMPDSSKQQLKKLKVDIKDVKEEGDKATVTYVTSADTKSQTLHMVKQNGKWLAQWTKQDQMGGDAGPGAGSGDQQGPADQPPMTADTTAAPPANPTSTPSSADTAMAK